MKALKVFTVKHGSIRIRVTLRETVRDVHEAYRANKNGMQLRRGEKVQAFFAPTQSTTAKHIGRIVLPFAGGDLRELVPHEVTHAVICSHGGVLPHDDEAAATAIGIISARIFRHIEKMGVAE